MQTCPLIGKVLSIIDENFDLKTRSITHTKMRMAKLYAGGWGEFSVIDYMLERV